MEKDILIQGLRTRIGDDDAKIISDKTFDGVATEVLSQFTDDSKITDDTWKLPVALLKQFAGQKRHDDKTFAEKFKTDYAAQYKTEHEKDVEARIAAAVSKAVEDYKKEHPEPKPNQKPDPNGGDEKDLDTKIADAIAKAVGGLTAEDGVIGKLTKTITDFTAGQAEREKNAKLAAVKNQLKQHLVGLKANNEACIDDALDHLDYGDNPTFDALKQSAVGAYEKQYKRYYGDGATPFGGNGTGEGPKGKTDSFVKARLEVLKKEAAEQEQYAQNLEKGFM